jgi:hypothetical protein
MEAQDLDPSQAASVFAPERRLGAHRVVGFISDTASSLDPGSIGIQKHGIDATADAAELIIEAYLIETGRPCPEDLFTPAIKDLLLRARTGCLDVIVLENVARLAPGRDEALLVAVLLAECGVRIVETVSDDHETARSRHAHPLKQPPGRPTRSAGRDEGGRS